MRRLSASLVPSKARGALDAKALPVVRKIHIGGSGPDRPAAEGSREHEVSVPSVLGSGVAGLANLQA